MEDYDKGLELSLGLACTGRPDTDERTTKILNDFRNFLNAALPLSYHGHPTSPVKPHQNFYKNFQHTASSAGNNKRKTTFDGTENTSKRQDIDSYTCVLHEEEKKHSPISVATGEGSTGDNEDVAESPALGGTGTGSVGSSPAPREITDGKSIVQTMNSSGIPYLIRDSSSSSAPPTSVYPLSLHSISPINGPNPRPHVMGTGSVPMTLTYLSVKIPDKDSSAWGISPSQPIPSPYYAGISTPTPDVSSAEPLRAARKPIVEEGSSSQPEGKTGSPLNDSSSFAHEYPAIKPGIAAPVKFGGSGALTSLPWVSTTGPGPNGKTISGVTYKYNATQIKIVCACHGFHLSPEEFIRHATGDQARAIPSTALTSLQSSNLTTTTASANT